MGAAGRLGSAAPSGVLASHASTACRTPWAFASYLERAQVVAHRHEHDMGVFQPQMPFMAVAVKRSLTFRICFQGVVAVRVAGRGNGAGIPMAAHRHRVENGDLAVAVCLGVAFHVRHEEPPVSCAMNGFATSAQRSGTPNDRRD